jgi:signal transduction histidine kinase/ligand-binding sensor domain-containing protein/DNA-binding response OmpR family regulator
MFIRVHLYLFSLLLFTLSLHARDLPIKYIGIEQGLSNNAVTSIYQDYYGFMWFGTYDGLNRYDGYDFKVFRNSIGDDHSINSNNINCLEGDWDHNVWVGSQKGLVVYDQGKSIFQPVSYLRYGAKSKQYLTQNVLKLNAVQNRFMLVATQDAGLIVFEGNMHEGTQIPLSGSPTPAAYHVAALEYPGKGDLVWVFIESRGLHVYDLKNRTFRLVNSKIKSARSIKWDATNTLWLGNDDGLFKYSVSGDTYSSNLLQVQTSVRDICIDKEMNLWIASDGTGVWILPRGVSSASPYLSSTGEVLVNSNAVYRIYQDAQGRKWVGTLRGGINLIEPRGSHFSRIAYNRHGSHKKLEEDFILSFCEDEKGDLWIGTDGAGLRRWKRDVNAYSQFKHDPRNAASISSNFVTNIIKDFKDDIWISTWFGGINRVNRDKGTFRRYLLNNTKTNTKEANSWIIFEDNLNNLWATAEGGIYRYNRSKDEFELFDETLSNLQSITIDRRGTMWAGNYSSLIKIDRLNKKHIFYSIGYPVRSIHEDKNQNFWVGTQDGGLLLMDAAKKKYKRYTTNDGLPNNTILRILEDKQSHLWLSTYKGLSKFHHPTSTFHNFSETDGLQSNQFSYNAALALKSGEFLFGGIKGFNLFHPDSTSIQSTIRKIFVTGLKINNVPIENSINHKTGWYPDQTNKVTIPYDSAVLSINYVALEYSGNDKLNYAYRLQGWDQGWNYVDKSRTANYSKLQEGEYTFKVKVRAPDGKWTSETNLLHISVLPPWYRTWWAYTIYTFLILLGLYAYVKYARWHEAVKYEIKLAHLENEKEKELAEKKLSFFTNISHEFRTPLTLIIDPLKDYIRNSKELVPQKSLETAYRNAQRLLSLVDQLMLFRKADTGHDYMKVSALNITDLCKEVFGCFEQIATAKNIRFSFSAPQEPAKVYGDYEKLEIIFFNLLSNAFKFTPENGSIGLEIIQTDGQVQIIVEDSGIGISPEQMGKLYEKYNRGCSSAVFSSSGFGIGLYLVKYFIDLHEGTIECQSELNRGTRFSMILKKDMQHQSDPVVTLSARNNELLKELFVHDARSEKADLPSMKAQTANELISEKKSILIIDDNDDITHYLEELFKETYIPYTAKNGIDGFNIVKDYLPDLVISDVHMQGMDGLELCKKIKKTRDLAHIPVILLTGSSADDTRLSGIEGGADDYLTKPFSSELLLARVDNILKNRNLIQSFFFDRVTLKPTAAKVPAEYRIFLENCIAVIEENLDKEDFCVTKFARKMGMSHSALYQKIRQVSGQSVNNFIRSIRLRRAAVLMLREDLQVKEAAFQVGLADVKYFREQFTKLFGMTPSEYIKRYRPSFNRNLNVVKE